MFSCGQVDTIIDYQTADPELARMSNSCTTVHYSSIDGVKLGQSYVKSDEYPDVGRFCGLSHLRYFGAINGWSPSGEWRGGEPEVGDRGVVINRVIYSIRELSCRSL